jgi:hypothetical protein
VKIEGFIEGSKLTAKLDQVKKISKDMRGSSYRLHDPYHYSASFLPFQELQLLSFKVLLPDVLD